MKKALFVSILASFIVISLPFAHVEAKTKKTVKKPTKFQIASTSKVTWSKSGLRELNKVPRFARPFMKKKIEAYAIENNIKVITAEIYNDIHV